MKTRNENHKRALAAQLAAAEGRMRSRLDRFKQAIREGREPPEPLADITREMRMLQRRAKAGIMRAS
jgi:hypothetical protein